MHHNHSINAKVLNIALIESSHWNNFVYKQFWPKKHYISKPKLLKVPNIWFAGILTNKVDDMHSKHFNKSKLNETPLGKLQKKITADGTAENIAEMS